MDNFFYILIGIAWVAYSLYSARQKAIKKQQSAGSAQSGPSQSSPFPIPGNQGSGKSVFDDILRELRGETAPVPQVQTQDLPVNSGNPNTAPDKPKSYELRSESNFVSSVPADSLKSASTMMRKPQQSTTKITRDVIASKRFNLRDAVIYSELLNPKYF